MNIYDDFKISGSPEIGKGFELDSKNNKTDGPVFKDMLKNLVDEVNTLQKNADNSIKGLATGETKDIHDVTIKLEEAGIAFDLMMEIRNKLVDAYQQIIRMQG